MVAPLSFTCRQCLCIVLATAMGFVRLVVAVPLPVPAVHSGIPPSSVFQVGTGGELAGPGSSVNHTVELEGGQVVSVVAMPLDPTLQLALTLNDGGADIGSSAAGAAGDAVSLQTITIGTSGTHTLAVENLTGTGTYTLEVWLNAAAEESGNNDLPADAQVLDGSSVSFGLGVTQYAVAGTCDGAVGEDWYSLSLTPGATVSMGLLVEGGDEAFGQEIQINVGASPVDVAAGEFDDVPGLDLLTASGGDGGGGGDGRGATRGLGALKLFHGNGDGTFSESAETVLPHPPICLAVGDLNGDTFPDAVVVVDNYDNWPPAYEVHIALNDGAGGLVLSGMLALTFQPVEIRIGDLDGVNGPDIVVSATEWNWDEGMPVQGQLCVAVNQGAGVFPAEFTCQATGMEKAGVGRRRTG